MAFELSALGKKPEYIKKQEDLNIEKAGGSYIPSISVLSTQAKQANKQDDKYIKGAEPGDVMISAPTPLIFKADVGIEIIPAVYREPYFLVWEHDNPYKTDTLGNRRENGSRKSKKGPYATYEEALANCDTDYFSPVKTIDYLVFSPSYLSKDDQQPLILRFDKPGNYRDGDDFGDTLMKEGNISAIKWKITSKYMKDAPNPHYAFKFTPLEYTKAKDFEAITQLAEVVKPAFLGQRKESVPQLSDKIQ